VRKFDVNAAIREAGNKRHSLGHGLSLYVRGNSALWVHRFRDRLTKRFRQTSLGSAKGYEAMSITQARDAHTRYRASLLDGTAPKRGGAVGKTFADALLGYLDARAGTWKGGMDGLEADAYRRLLDLDLANTPLSQIDTSAVRAALSQWDGKSTSGKVRIKIKSVIDFATASGWYHGANPAAAKTMGKIIPAVAKAKHHDAMPWGDLPAFMRDLAAFDTPASRALRFTILCAARAGETRFATWSEIQGDVWSRPAEHMKEGIAHSVPLTSAAIALLGQRGDPGELIFKSSPTGATAKRRGTARVAAGILPEGAMRDHVKDRGYKVHGFRSTFTDWAAENGYPFELGELALAHKVGNSVAQAYRRTNMIKERRPMMQAYADFATSA
jgi:integrase